MNAFIIIIAMFPSRRASFIVAHGVIFLGEEKGVGARNSLEQVSATLVSKTQEADAELLPVSAVVSSRRGVPEV